MPLRVHIVRNACIYAGEEVVVTLGKQKDRTHMKTKAKMSAIKLAAFQLYNLLVWLYHRPVDLQALICRVSLNNPLKTGAAEEIYAKSCAWFASMLGKYSIWSITIHVLTIKNLANIEKAASVSRGPSVELVSIRGVNLCVKCRWHTSVGHILAKLLACWRCWSLDYVVQ